MGSPPLGTIFIFSDRIFNFLIRFYRLNLLNITLGNFHLCRNVILWVMHLKIIVVMAQVVIGRICIPLISYLNVVKDLKIFCKAFIRTCIFHTIILIVFYLDIYNNIFFFLVLLIAVFCMLQAVLKFIIWD